MAWALQVLGNIEVSLGDHDSGRRCFERSLSLTIELNFAWGIAFSLEGLARRRRTVGIPLPAFGRLQLDGMLGRAREALPEADMTAAFARGQRLDDETPIASLGTERVLPARSR